MVSLKPQPRPERVLGVLSIVAIAIAAAGCSGTTTDTTVRPATTTTTAVVTTSTTAEVPTPEPVDWNDPAVQVELGDGWTVAACAGDAPLLCVAKDGSEVGVVEAAAYEIDAFENIDPEADPETILRQFGTGFIDSLTTDRKSGCGDDYQVTPMGPSPFSFDTVDVGVTFGFEGGAAGDEPSELVLQYAAIFGDKILSLVAAAYDEDGCLGRDELGGFTTEQLKEVRDNLESVLAVSPLPIEKAGIETP